MKQGLRMKCRRATSGVLAVAMSAILTLSDAGAAFAAAGGNRFVKDVAQLVGEQGFSKATVSNASFANHLEEDLVISITSSDDSDFRSGGMVFLDVHIKNETDKMITDGVLSYHGRGLGEENAYFEELLEDPIVDSTLIAEEESEEEEVWEDDVELINDLTEEQLSDFNFDESEKWDDSEDAEEEEEEEFPQKIKEIELAPGEIYTARFVYMIDESIDDSRTRSIDFRFRGDGEEQRISQDETFHYAVNHLNIDAVKFQDGNRVKTGETVTMGIHASMYDFDAVLSDSVVDKLVEELEKETIASPSDAEKVEIPIASPSDAAIASPSDADMSKGPGAVTEAVPEGSSQLPAEAVGPGAESEDAAENEAEAEKESADENEAVTGSESVTDNGAENGAVSESESVTETETAVENERVSESESAPASESAEETGAESESESAAEIGAESESESAAEIGAESESESAAEIGAESEGESVAETETAVESERVSESESASASESAEETGAESESESAEEIGAESEGESIAETETAVESKTVSESESAPASESAEETEDESESENTAEHETVMESASSAVITAPSREMKNATSSDADEEDDEDEFVIDLGKISYEIQMINAKLNDFEIHKALVGDANDNMLVCTYRVSNSVEPGVYFGRIIQETKDGGRTLRSTQGFSIVVTGDGEVVLEGSSGDSTVTVSGPVDHFPDANQLAVRVAEVEIEQQAQVDAALEKKAAEEGVEIKSYKALDIKIFADGQEVQPTGPIQVAFKDVELENKTEGNLVERAVEAVKELVNPEKKESEEAVSEIKTFHLDEEAVEVNEMSSEVQEDGTVVMDTDHFSIYIVVNIRDLEVLEVPIRIEHWATVNKMTLTYNDDGTVNDNHNERDFIYPGEVSDGKYGTETIKIYADDQVTLPNGGGTGIGYSIAVKNWSKVSLGGNYAVDYIEANGNIYQEKPETDSELSGNVSEDQIIHLDAKDNVLKIYYKPTTGSTRGYVGFHDYNVTIGSEIGEKHHNGLRSDRVGINKVSEVTSSATDNRIGVGIRGNGNHAIFHDFKGDANNEEGKVVKKIPDKKFENGNIKFNYADPGLFRPVDIMTEEIYYKGTKRSEKTVSYFAKKYLPNYELEFNRNGDTYTLESVYDDGGNKLIENLSILRKTHEKPLYSNLFWPLDEVNYGEELKTRDPLFGRPRSAGALKDNYGFSINDEEGQPDLLMNDKPTIKNVEHNWFFGMRYDFSFEVGDYVGPMNYYFRGDDDFWLFINGELVEPVDIGGIHSAKGVYVDLKEWMLTKGILKYEDGGNEISKQLSEESKSKSIQMSVFYMERGGYGSCCYMKFTLPNLASIPTPGAELTSVTATKAWIDNNNASGIRPDYIYLQLKQDGVDYRGPVKVVGGKKESTWSYTWDNLPKFSNVNSSEEHEYSYEEVAVPPEYEQFVSNSGIINTQLIKAVIEKFWNDWPEQVEEPPVYVDLFIENDNGTYSEVDNQDIVQLTPQEPSAAWENLPKYKVVDDNIDNQIEIKYVPLEVVKKGNEYVPLLPGDTAGGTDDRMYVVTYNDNHSVITNTYNYTEHSVTKKWDDYNNAYSTRPGNIQVQLYQQAGNSADVLPYGKPVTLNSKNEWTANWTNLPITVDGEVEYIYTVKEVDSKNEQVGDDDTAVFTVKSGKDYQYKADIADTDDTVDNGVQGADPQTFTITNKLETVKLKLKKVVENEGVLPNEPIDNSYKFMIHLKNKSDGTAYTTAALGHEEESDWIVLAPPVSGQSFVIEEIIPMEYTMTGISAEGGASLEGSTLTVKPDDGDTVITVTNKPAHSGYYHHTASITNVKSNWSAAFVKQEETWYKEEHGGTLPSSAQASSFTSKDMQAVVRRRMLAKEEGLLEKGDDLCG